MATLAAHDVIFLHATDNLGVAVRNLSAGTKVEREGKTLTLAEPIGMGHKFAARDIRQGETVRKYGQIIGLATTPIRPGELIHSHNLAMAAAAFTHEKSTAIPPPPPRLGGKTFQGYRRAGGKTGTRNYIAIVSTVNCSASVSKYIARRFDEKLLRDYPNVDGVIALTHSTGCGMQFGGLNHELLTRTLGGVAKHANVGAFLLIGLGCEQGAMGYLLERQNLLEISTRWGEVPPAATTNDSPAPPFVMSMQDLGGTAKTIEEGVRRLAQLLPRANDVRRETIPASEIILGLNCGGSDGASGITANPALGYASDLLVAAGGTAALAETTEVYGAEHLLTQRARTPAVAEKLLERIEWWKWYTSTFGADIDNNPSVGNKAGGLTTIAEKSLGAVAKAGSTALNAVYEYAEQMDERGLVFMDTPGFDPPSVTGLIAGGANVVVFTTGRGSCFACKPVPTIKVATNTPMYEHMIDDMDINAGRILSDGASIEEVGQEIFGKMLSVASGEKTKSEQQGLGDEEFVPWVVGPVL